ncbi:MAG: threonylcarbamoyl-AMP synthase [Nevskiaceae bacterium]|nr:MAG: threonylcarbamoyl-AMP synthase [Nevskiaceae bacterium]TBR74052.1 MAG: threonylcarbamoyl-AMP synthase [Nevskiaceae bacterium]
MAEWLELHPQNPQTRWIRHAVERLNEGAVIVYPTDSCYALGCVVGDKDAAERVRRIRRIDRHHLFTLVCRDLSEIATYAKVDNRQYRLLKLATPGPFTFVLQATRELPRRIQHEKRKTIGIRVPDHPGAQALLAELGKPLLSCTLQFPDAEYPVNEPQEWRRQLDGVVDIVLDSGSCGLEPTTVVDLTNVVPEVLRRGRGDLARLGL